MKNIFNTEPITLSGNFSFLDFVSGPLKMSVENQKKTISKFNTNSAIMIYPQIFFIIKALKGKMQGINIAYTNSKAILEKNNLCVCVESHMAGGMTVFSAYAGVMDNKNELTWSNKDEDGIENLIATLVVALLSFEEEMNESISILERYIKSDENSNSLLTASVQDQIYIYMAKISSNIRGRLLSSSNDAIKIEYHSNEMKKDMLEISNPVNTIDNFKYFDVKIGKNKPAHSSEYNGFYALEPERKWTDEEFEMIPHIDDEYVVPDYVFEDAGWIYNSIDFRNIYYHGPSGTGKTTSARMLAAILGRPYGKYTCSVDTEIFSLIGQVFPNTGGSEAITASDIIKECRLPDLEDIMFDSASAYTKITGREKPKNMDQTGVITALFDRVLNEMKNLVEQNSSEFSYVESGLIKAVRNGYVFEIQEPTVIKRAVLVGLNGILDPAGGNLIELPNGETLKKHEHCVIVFTSNDDYEGCSILNQSVLDRMSICRYIEDISDEEKKARLKQKTNLKDESLLNRMIMTMNDVNTAMKENDITDGVFGMRSLQNWATAIVTYMKMNGYKKASQVPKDVIYDIANVMVVGKLSQSVEDRETLITVFNKNFSRI